MFATACACSPQPEATVGPSAVTATAPPRRTPPLEDSSHATSPATPLRPEPIVLADAPELLQAPQLDIGPLLFGKSAPGSTLELQSSRRYRELAASLRDEGVQAGWVRSSKTSYELAAVVNRLDRMDVIGGCGETRLVYRLVRDQDEKRESLPLSLNVVFAQREREDGCKSVAASWRVANDTTLGEQGGPLSPQALSDENLLAVEVNATVTRRDAPQNVLFILQPQPTPRFDRPTWVSGRMEFEPSSLYKGRGWRRVTEILTQPEMRQAIHDGTPSLLGYASDQYYDDWASTRVDGLRRVARELADDADYAPFDSKDAYLARARSLTCGGCHDTRASNGFHLAMGPSAHFSDEEPWRRAYVEAVSEGREPQRVRQPVRITAR